MSHQFCIPALCEILKFHAYVFTSHKHITGVPEPYGVQICLAAVLATDACMDLFMGGLVRLFIYAINIQRRCLVVKFI